MNVGFLQQNIIKLLSQRNNLTLLVGGLLVSNVLLSSAILWKSEETILVPLQIEGQLRIQKGKASPEYLEHMGRDFARLLLDVSPGSFSYNHKTILKYVAPESYGSIQKQLITDGEQITALQLSTHFKPIEITAYPETMEVEVKGTLSSFISGKHLRDSQETILLQFTERGSGLLLESVTGGIPHES